MEDAVFMASVMRRSRSLRSRCGACGFARSTAPHVGVVAVSLGMDARNETIREAVTATCSVATEVAPRRPSWFLRLSLGFVTLLGFATVVVVGNAAWSASRSAAGFAVVGRRTRRSRRTQSRGIPKSRTRRFPGDQAPTRELREKAPLAEGVARLDRSPHHAPLVPAHGFFPPRGRHRGGVGAGDPTNGGAAVGFDRRRDARWRGLRRHSRRYRGSRRGASGSGVQDRARVQVAWHRLE